MSLNNDAAPPKQRRKVIIQDSEEIYEAMVAPIQGEDETGDVVLDLVTGCVIYSPVREGWGDEEVDGALADGRITEEDITLAEKLFENPATRARYLKIPEGESWWGSQDLTAFLETVEDPNLHNRLARCIRGAGTFGRIKVTLDQAGKDWLDRWNDYQAKIHEARVKEWLKSEGVELIEDPNRKKPVP